MDVHLIGRRAPHSVDGWYRKPRPKEATSAVSLGIGHLPGLSTSFHTLPESSITYLNADIEGDGE